MARAKHSFSTKETKVLPKRQLKRLDQKIIPLTVPFILFSWVLIKIGQIPLGVIKLTALPFKLTLKSLKHIYFKMKDLNVNKKRSRVKIKHLELPQIIHTK